MSCVIDNALCTKLRLVDMAYYASARPGRFSSVFARHLGQVLSWYDVIRLYLEAQAARYSPLEILWMQNARTTNDHMLWIGLFATDGISVKEMLRAFQEIVDHERHMHVLWENIQTRDLEKTTNATVFSWGPPGAFSVDKTMSCGTASTTNEGDA